MNRTNDFYSFKNILPPVIATLLYLGLSRLLVGFKTDQLVLSGIFNATWFATPASRRFIRGFSIFIVYWIIFDYMKAFPNYWFNEVHIQDLYNHEKALFGIHNGDTILTPNEYWLQHQSSMLDVLTGVFYLCWIPVPLAFATYLFFTQKELFLRFSLTFVLVNLIGFIIYYIYPAAPPWYIQLHGNEFIAGTRGNTAGLARFDAFFGVTIFENLYTKGSNVFAAMPSLHSAYPLIVFYYGGRSKMPLHIKLLFALVMAGIWFAAIYTSHHYLLDVLAGILTAITGILIFNSLDARNMRFRSTLNSFSCYI